MIGINTAKLGTKVIPYGGKYAYSVTFKNTGTTRDAIIGVSLIKSGTNTGGIDLCWFKIFSFPAGAEATLTLNPVIPSDTASDGATSALEPDTYYDAIAKAWDKITSPGTKIEDIYDQNGNKVGEIYKAGSGVLETVLDSLTVPYALYASTRTWD